PHRKEGHCPDGGAAVDDQTAGAGIWWRKITGRIQGCRIQRGYLRVRLTETSLPASHPEKLGIACLDLFALRLHRRRIALQKLDVGQRRASLLLLHERME